MVHKAMERGFMQLNAAANRTFENRKGKHIDMGIDQSASLEFWEKQKIFQCFSIAIPL
jgi:hypothetical protein